MLRKPAHNSLWSSHINKLAADLGILRSLTQSLFTIPVLHDKIMDNKSENKLRLLIKKGTGIGTRVTLWETRGREHEQ